MKLDYNLIRDILFKFEDITDGYKGYPVQDVHGLHFSNIDFSIFRYHVKYLIDIKYLEASTNYPPYIRDISPNGREYLNAIRSDTVWKKINEKLIIPLGNVSFTIILRLLPDILKNIM